MKHLVTLIEGDGIGPEVSGAAVKVLEAAGADIQWETVPMRLVGSEDSGQELLDAALNAIRRTKVALKGPITTPVASGIPSINVRLRKVLDLYANVRPVCSLPGVPSLYPNVNLTIVRENTEDLYSGIEREVAPGVMQAVKVISEKASLRIARFAFQYARQNGQNTLLIAGIHRCLKSS